MLSLASYSWRTSFLSGTDPVQSICPISFRVHCGGSSILMVFFDTITIFISDQWMIVIEQKSGKGKVSTNKKPRGFSYFLDFCLVLIDRQTLDFWHKSCLFWEIIAAACMHWPAGRERANCDFLPSARCRPMGALYGRWQPSTRWQPGWTGFWR